MSEPDPITEGPILVEFECQALPLPPGTPAAPRPSGRPREGDVAVCPTDADAAFVRELADRVLEYVQSRPSGLSAAQLAALIQHFLRTPVRLKGRLAPSGLKHDEALKG